MATTFKTLNSANDVTSTRTLLHEAIPLTGTITSGTYDDNNIKTYSHGMFESVYDYPVLSSSANHIFDITTGYASNSSLSGSGVQNSKKLNVYSQMAQVLVGYDATGSIQNFDQDGDIALGGTKINEAIFVNFSRLLTKDEIKKGSFVASFLTGGTPAARTDTLTLQDHGAATSYKVNSPAGEYGILYTGSEALAGTGVGLVYYQAGVAVLTGSIFDGTDMGPGVSSGTYDALATGSNIEVMADSFRNRLDNISFNNTVELNSTVYFCRASHNEFNYSNNPTYLSSSQIRVKNSTTDNPVSYVTTVGLYSSDNELLAVAKLSEPLKKDPNTEVTLRVRLDF
jgi:hypothetical protein